MENNYHIGIGITGGIAGYKIVGLIKSLKKKKISASVIMTDSAVRMFGTEMFEKASERKVYRDMIPEDFNYQEVLKFKKVEHIALADSLDLLLIAPASANFIAKMAAGISDDYLTTLVLSVTCPLLVAPSMNTNMWHKKITGENTNKLKEFKVSIIPPDSGQLACGYQGIGRLKDIGFIEEKIMEILIKKEELKGKKILVTAGSTEIPLDAVRKITNRATGKFGKSIAELCMDRGAEVLLLRSENSVIPDFKIKEFTFRTNKDLEALLAKHCPYYDIIFHSAAVSDFYPGNVNKKKIDSSKSFVLKFQPEKKLINLIKKWNPNIMLIGFKAAFRPKSEEISAIGKKILIDSKADYVVINDIGRDDIGFASDYNEVYLLRKGSVKPLKFDRALKYDIAGKLIDAIIGNKYEKKD